MNMPIYDGGSYCVEHMENGKWRKKKTGKYLSRNWNHITLRYALHQYETLTRLGNAARIVHEPTSEQVADNGVFWLTNTYLKWRDLLESHFKHIESIEHGRR